jgi:hypothetical protein
MMDLSRALCFGVLPEILWDLELITGDADGGEALSVSIA